MHHRNRRHPEHQNGSVEHDFRRHYEASVEGQQSRYGMPSYDRGFDQGYFGRGDQGPVQEGRGPKSYRRRDERIHEEICEALSDGTIDAREIEVSVSDGTVSLRGSVSDRHSKHDAEDCAWSIRGVRAVENALRVQRGPDAQTRRASPPAS
jgi:osmotically-inducible protein OsmY